jgi:hypothetical protein
MKTAAIDAKIIIPKGPSTWFFTKLATSLRDTSTVRAEIRIKNIMKSFLRSYLVTVIGFGISVFLSVLIALVSGSDYYLFKKRFL